MDWGCLCPEFSAHGSSFVLPSKSGECCMIGCCMILWKLYLEDPLASISSLKSTLAQISFWLREKKWGRVQSGSTACRTFALHTATQVPMWSAASHVVCLLNSAEGGLKTTTTKKIPQKWELHLSVTDGGDYFMKCSGTMWYLGFSSFFSF